MILDIIRVPHIIDARYYLDVEPGGHISVRCRRCPDINQPLALYEGGASLSDGAETPVTSLSGILALVISHENSTHGGAQ